MRKSLVGLTAIALAVGVLVWSTQARPLRPRNNDPDTAESPSVFGGAHSSTGLTIESTGFETSDGWNLGFICDPGTFTNCLGPPLPLPGACDGDPLVDGNCCADDPNPYTGWYLSNSSEHCKEPHIDTANPATDDQHIRFVNDLDAGVPAGCTGTGTACRITAFTPIVAGLGSTPTTVSYNIAMGGTPASPPYGSSFVMWFLPEAGSGDSHYFNFYGTAYFYDYGLGIYYPMGYMTGGEVYDSVVEFRDPCATECGGVQDTNGCASYTFNGATTYQSAGMAGMAGSLARLIMVHDNNIYPWDIDDYSIVRGDPCPTFCDGVALEPGEECDGPGLDDNCPGRCYPAGHENECMCERPGSCEEPTVAVNGFNGPFLTHGGFFEYTADTDYIGIHTCGGTEDTEIWWDFDEACELFQYNNDECDEGDADPDPNAPCYNNSYPPGASCLNIPTVPGTTYKFAVGLWNDIIPPTLGSEISFTITKKTGPGEPIPNGACCDGQDGVCTDNVPVEQCAGEYNVWTENKLCSMIGVCPGGACCDAGPGLGGACTDDVYADACGGDDQTYSFGELCDAVTCEEVTGACCDTLLGVCTDGLLQAQCPAPLVWTQDTPCAQVSCNPATGACCNHDDGTCTVTTTMACDCEKCEWTRDADCTIDCDANFTPIPTVSEWGLAILALLLLTGAKVYFGRRQAATA